MNENILWLHELRLADLAEINRVSGRVATDDLLRRCGAVLNEVAADETDALAARLNGADFALLTPLLASPQSTAERLLERFAQELAHSLPERTNVWLGGGRFDRGIEPGAILAQVDAALAPRALTHWLALPALS